MACSMGIGSRHLRCAQKESHMDQLITTSVKRNIFQDQDPSKVNERDAGMVQEPRNAIVMDARADMVVENLNPTSVDEFIGNNQIAINNVCFVTNMMHGISNLNNLISNSSNNAT